MSEQKFLYDRDVRGHVLEELIVSYLHNRGIPTGYNRYSGTDDLRREWWDLYMGDPEVNPTTVEVKLDWQSAFSGNLFVEEKAVRNSHAHLFVYGKLLLQTYRRDQLLAMLEAKNTFHRPDGTTFEQFVYPRKAGGDQEYNQGILLNYDLQKQHSQPFWKAVQQLM